MGTFWAICRWVLAIIVGAVIAAYGSILFMALFAPAILPILTFAREHNLQLSLFLLGLQNLLGMFFGGALGATAAVFINRKIRPFLTAYLAVFGGLLIVLSSLFFYGRQAILFGIYAACDAVGLLAGGTLAGYLGLRLGKAGQNTINEK